ncbi:YceI family protein [soil metagenome]
METLEKDQVKSVVTIYKVNTNKSIVNWHGKKVLGQHNGTVKISDGNIFTENGKITGGNVKVDISTLESLDLAGDLKTKAMLEGHLKSDDFFNAEKYPEITFKINSVENVINGETNKIVKGEMTIREITRAVSFPAKVINENNMITADIDADIDRTDYDLKYGSGKFFAGLGDNLISDKFNIKIHILAQL